MAIQPYKKKCVRIIDIDGTVIHKVQGDSTFSVEPLALPGALKRVDKWFDNGDYIVFWTARPSAFKEQTLATLDKLGFRYHEVVFDKPYSHEIHFYDDNLMEAHKVVRDMGIGYLDDKE